MAYDSELAKRIKAKMAGLPSLEEKKMFGGVGFLLNGNLACGVQKNAMIVRVAPEKHAELLTRAHARPFDMTGRPMKGWLIVDAEGCKTDKQLSTWIKEGVDFALTLPKKKK
jgi:TfoX/Sxy family transcriptional regulator of competence genes